MEVLVVDDSKTMRMLVQRAIRQAGFSGLTFIEAENGARALEALSSSKPSLILSDWNMPEMTGIQFLQNVRASGINIPFGFITSEGSKEILDTATAAGANFLITKPFTSDDVQASLSPFVGA
ncbi:response regulator [Terriglobus sp. RCC_193]|uniref:response regulator n=1 Tax=Terriglobus sp. RCC_193 TaxID=3239218 RepID=UPI0035263A95